jgi:hypothetical protein
LTDTDKYRILLSIEYYSVSPEAPMTNVTATPRHPVTSIGKREAQAWLMKQLGYERVLARLRAAHAAEKTGERERGVAA